MRCPSCGSENPPDTTECPCGHSLLPERNSASDGTASDEKTRYFPVSVFKFCVMSVCTLGVYQLYWFYRNWSHIRERDNSDIWPLVRALFGIFTYPLLLGDLNDEESRSQEEGLQLTAPPSVLGPSAGYIVANALWRMPGLLSWFGLLSFVPLLPALRRINSLNGPDNAAYAHNSRWRVRHALLLVIMVPLLGLLIAADVGLLPSDAVQSGRLLSDSARAHLQKAVLRRGEEVLYFSSPGFLSHSGAGSLLTDERVVLYRTDPESAELHVESASFSSIRDVAVEYGHGSDPTSVTVNKRNGTAFVLRLPTAQGGDRLFVDELRNRLPFGTALIAR
jgi:hypothetical protein